ncbi:MAG: DUF58 domain-containing protein [Crocosphaera sp.]|uniref:DUF58 domain-containing protein n=4 Tax=Crocosphaera watsonii TaxID=263511 RepID=G5J8P5_CROWT|nr:MULTISPECIES: DUF58 domain-containing protein [Crocosphaera]EHJ11428.1 hypothetical protein CWATWH0003_3822 [Crocosphaera watsonii WH 0003]MCH2245854.1 DUF58 domain-containing protein [Crocosphaera sp.]CCQ59015.1 hypothetical protein CWATWH0005_251 [Crocosphaera watsonii WH 0005]
MISKGKPNFTDWLETHWTTPAFSGWLLAVLALCFFGAATNTMAGWLYVLSGTILALLILGAILSVRSLSKIRVRRHPLNPVSAGEDLTIEVIVENKSKSPKTLLQLWDLVPSVIDKPQNTAVETIIPQGEHHWTYYLKTQRRGVYHWHDLELRSGSPLGLFWCRRSQDVPAKAVVYPQILPLNHCPLIDTIGQEESDNQQSDRRFIGANEGVTKALRPYRYGDPMRMIHWRTSAKYDEFQVRELEVITGGEDIIICLDSASSWLEDNFEQAVIAAASLYFYASRAQLNVKLWTAKTGLINGNRTVLETLAAVTKEEEDKQDKLPTLPLIWLTENTATLDKLPSGSRWLLFPQENVKIPSFLGKTLRGLVINSEISLENQLEKIPQ